MQPQVDQVGEVPVRRRRWLLPLLLGVVVAVVVAVSFTVTTVCPGCNHPQVVSIDHYLIQNNTSQMPSLLTVWFKSYASSDQGLTLKTIYLKDITPNCNNTGLNPQTLPTDPTQHPFNVTGVIADSATIPVSIDTSTSNFYFTRGHCYELTLVTDKLGAAFVIRYG